MHQTGEYRFHHYVFYLRYGHYIIISLYRCYYTTYFEGSQREAYAKYVFRSWEKVMSCSAQKNFLLITNSNLRCVLQANFRKHWSDFLLFRLPGKINIDLIFYFLGFLAKFWFVLQEIFWKSLPLSPFLGLLANIDVFCRKMSENFDPFLHIQASWQIFYVFFKIV